MALIHLLDLLGVCAFAVYGSHKAIVARFDIFGVALCGAITALGGGTIRDMLINHTPVYFHDYNYLAAAALGTGIAIAVHARFTAFEKYLRVVDAIGLAVFAYVGAYRADMADLGLAAMIFFATLTAAGGGVISDLISGRRPEALYKDAYPLAAVILAVEYYTVRPAGHSAVTALVLIAMAFGIRLASIHLRLKFWRPHSRPHIQKEPAHSKLPVAVD